LCIWSQFLSHYHLQHPLCPNQWLTHSLCSSTVHIPWMEPGLLNFCFSKLLLSSSYILADHNSWDTLTLDSYWTHMCVLIDRIASACSEIDAQWKSHTFKIIITHICNSHSVHNTHLRLDKNEHAIKKQGHRKWITHLYQVARKMKNMFIFQEQNIQKGNVPHIYTFQNDFTV
jgi:hypothetical protein